MYKYNVSNHIEKVKNEVATLDMDLNILIGF